MRTPDLTPGRSASPGSAEAPLTPRSPWQWRYRMAERVAASLDAERFGVVACYLIGSAKNATSAAGSDIDLVVHVRGSAAQLRALSCHLTAWSRWLGIANALATGEPTTELLDVHLVTDEDIARRTSFAVKIDAVTDGAHALALGPAVESDSRGASNLNQTAKQS